MDMRVAGIGEVLWDLLLTGPQLGGAPANFAYHAHALGAQTHVITSVGNDDYGREIIRRFQAMDLSDVAVHVDETAATGTAKVTLSGDPPQSPHLTPGRGHPGPRHRRCYRRLHHGPHGVGRAAPKP